jgi:hypothetical protein
MNGENRVAQEDSFLILMDPVSGTDFCTNIYDEITKILTDNHWGGAPESCSSLARNHYTRFNRPVK